MNRPHPSMDTLVSLLVGELPPEEAESLLEHVADCSHCLARCEETWAQTSPLSTRAEEEIDPEVAARVEHRLLRRLRCLDLSESVVGFAGGGFAFVMLRLIEPIAHFFSRASASQERK